MLVLLMNIYCLGSGWDLIFCGFYFDVLGGYRRSHVSSLAGLMKSLLLHKQGMKSAVHVSVSTVIPFYNNKASNK